MVDKKGTIWLLQRLKAGEVLTQEASTELLAYIGQLEVSQDAAKRHYINQLFNSLDVLTDTQTAIKIQKSIEDALEVKKEEPKFEFSDRLVQRDVRYPEELDSTLADIAHYNKMSTNDVIVRLLEQAVKIPGFFGFKNGAH